MKGNIMTVKFKQGMPVKATGSRQTTLLGRVAKVRDEGPGQGRGVWIDVNVAPKGKPSQIKSYRAKAVVPA